MYTEWRCSRRLENIGGLYWDWMVRFNQVDFGEDGLACQVRGEILDVRGGILVRDCVRVECVVITTRRQSPAMTVDEVEV